MQTVGFLLQTDFICKKTEMEKKYCFLCVFRTKTHMSIKFGYYFLFGRRKKKKTDFSLFCWKLKSHFCCDLFACCHEVHTLRTKKRIPELHGGSFCCLIIFVLDKKCLNQTKQK